MGNRAGRRISRGWLVGAAAAVSLIAVGSFASGATLKTKSASTTVGPFPDTGGVTATCKKGQKVVSGGFAGDEGTTRAIIPYSSVLEGAREWTVAAIGTDVQGTLTSYAYCRDGKRLRAESETITVPEEGPLGAGTATARCGQGKRAISGGFTTEDPTSSAPQVFPYASLRDGKREWTVSAVSYSSQPRTMTAFAYCQKSDRRLKTRSASTTIGPFPDAGAATAKCKRGQRVVSGGFDNLDFDPDSDAGPQIIPFVSMRQSRRTWTGSAYNEGSETGTFTVYAYCEKRN